MHNKDYGVIVSGIATFLENASNLENSQYIFGYSISIKNSGENAIQLISRNWTITNANNQTQNIQGLGVIGHQPTLQPQEEFKYQSYAGIDTPIGFMQGSYDMVTEDGESFCVDIPAFTLAVPQKLN